MVVVAGEYAEVAEDGQHAQAIQHEPAAVCEQVIDWLGVAVVGGAARSVERIDPGTEAGLAATAAEIERGDTGHGLAALGEQRVLR